MDFSPVDSAWRFAGEFRLYTAAKDDISCSDCHVAIAHVYWGPDGPGNRRGASELHRFNSTLLLGSSPFSYWRERHSSRSLPYSWDEFGSATKTCWTSRPTGRTG